MAKMVARKNTTILETKEFIERHILKLGMSVTMVDEINDGEHWFVVYEKYYMRASNRVSLSIHLYKKDTTVYIEAISAAGGQGAIFRFSWGSEASFLSDFMQLINRLDFEIIVYDA